MYESMPNIYEVQLDSLKDAIDMSIKYMEKEAFEKQLINYLINSAYTQYDLQILSSIKHDTEKHFLFLKDFYFYFSHNKSLNIKMKKFNRPSNYVEGIKKALLNNHDNIKLFTQFYILMNQSVYNESFTNMAFITLQDMQRHNSEYNSLLSLASI